MIPPRSGRTDGGTWNAEPGVLGRWLASLLLALVLLLALALPPPVLGGSPAFALDPVPAESGPLATGGRLFEAHCAGCHARGGNVIRRGRTLKLAALQRHGIDDPEAIAAIAAGGIGQMGGYGEILGEGGPEAVAAWVWRQALEGWPRT